MHRIRYLLRETFELQNDVAEQPPVEQISDPETSLSIDEGCGLSEEAWQHLNAFAQFCQENLGLPNLPNVHIVATREGGMTTGAYDPQSHEILVYGKNRALVDIMRTLAHELTHYRQRLQDKIKSAKRDWNLEGEADAEAGKMVYTYTHSAPENMGVYEL